MILLAGMIAAVVLFVVLLIKSTNYNEEISPQDEFKTGARYEYYSHSAAEELVVALQKMGYVRRDCRSDELRKGQYTYHSFYASFRIYCRTKEDKEGLNIIISDLYTRYLPTPEQIKRREAHNDELLSSGATNIR